MATPMRSQALAAQGAAIVAAADDKARWVKLAIEELPKDGQALALAAMESECIARRNMDAFKAWAADKASVPAGLKRVYALERGVTDPNMMADILYKDVPASQGGAVRGSWSQFTGTK